MCNDANLVVVVVVVLWKECKTTTLSRTKLLLPKEYFSLLSSIWKTHCIIEPNELNYDATSTDI